MKKTFNKNPLLLLGFLALALVLILDHVAIPLYKNHQVTNEPSEVQTYIHKKSRSADSIFSKLKSLAEQRNSPNFGEYIKTADKEGIRLYIYKNNNLVFWNDNQVLPNTQKPPSTYFSLAQLGNGLYLQKTAHYKSFNFYILLPVKTDYTIQNEYLENKIILNNRLNNYFKISLDPEKGKAIQANNGDFLFSLEKLKSFKSFSWYTWIYFFSLVLLFFGFSRFINLSLFKKRYRIAIVSYALVSLLSCITIFYLESPATVFNQPIFKTGILHLAFPFSSLGVIMVILALFTLFIHYLTKYFPLKNHVKLPGGLIKLLAFFVFSLLATHFAVSLIKALVLKSEIYLDIENFYDLTFLSLIASIIIFLTFYNLITFNYWFFNHAKTLLDSRYSVIFSAFTGIIIIYHFITFYTTFPNYYSGIFNLLLWSGFWLFAPKKPYSHGPLIYFVLLTSFFTAFHLLKFNQDKEIKRQKYLATRVTYQRDLVAEHLFSNVSREIKADKYTKEFFFNPLLPKDFLTKRIQELYFSRYLNKYDLQIHTFKYGGISYKDHTQKPLKYYQQLINKYGLKTPGKNLYYINKTGANPTYLAIYNFNILGGHYATLVVELKQKVFYDESIYPELLLEQTVKSENHLENYSYAVYKNKKLISQKGNYPYPVKTTINNNGKVYHHFSDNDYEHLFHQVSHNTFVIISKQSSGIIHVLSLFSFLFILFFVFSFFSLAVQKWNFKKVKSIPNVIRAFIHGYHFPFKNLLFQRKIQFSILIIVLLVMTTVGISTVNYLKFNYNQKLDDELNKKIKQILPEIEEYIQTTEAPQLYNNQEEFYAQIKNLTKRFQTDINLFNLNGKLITSSQPRVYQKNILAGVMNSSAFYQMKINNKSQLIQNEKIGNLDYLAAYAPVRNPQNQIIGFLNLPYFSKETKLKQEISSLIITLVDLYVFIFLLVIVVSLFISNTITRPLNLIREKLKRTQLGQSNEPINWESRDELGQLIREYNRMIVQLEQNAKALAESEREGAWREMARQVAHEIKNPLTPMKLNIQRLQRQFSSDKDQRSAEVKKVSNILIQQIDHLSKIATEFSAFAQIPLGEPVEIEVEKTLSEMKEFFGQENGITVSLNLNTDHTKALIDKNHFNRIFTNLLKNAQQAIPEDKSGEIEIGSDLHDNYALLIWVKDNGVGINEDQKQRIFQPNFSTKNSGTGLGLAMVKKMVESAGGQIWFSSNDGEGVTFYVMFHVNHSGKAYNPN